METDMPKNIKKLLFSSFTDPSFYNPEWFNVLSNKANQYLTDKFGLYTDSPVFSEDGMNFRFEWRTEKWCVQ